KYADAHTSRSQIRDDRRQASNIGRGRPARLTGDFPRHNRYERALIRPDPAHEIDEIRSGIAFDVEFNCRSLAFQRLGDVVHVPRLDVALIGSRMNGDSLNARAQADVHGVEHARLDSTP